MTDNRKRYLVVSSSNVTDLETQLNEAWRKGYEVKHVVARGDTPGHMVAILELIDNDVYPTPA